MSGNKWLNIEVAQNTMEVGDPWINFENNVQAKKNMQQSMQNEAIHAK